MLELGLSLQTFGTLGFALAFIYAARRATEKHRRSNAPESALSRDKAFARISRAYGR
ncbi:MAG: hypothetical protein AAFN09_02765 [Pseudomonadota bacterium]